MDDLRPAAQHVTIRAPENRTARVNRRLDRSHQGGPNPGGRRLPGRPANIPRWRNPAAAAGPRITMWRPTGRPGPTNPCTGSGVNPFQMESITAGRHCAVLRIDRSSTSTAVRPPRNSATGLTDLAWSRHLHHNPADLPAPVFSPGPRARPGRASWAPQRAFPHRRRVAHPWWPGKPPPLLADSIGMKTGLVDARPFPRGAPPGRAGKAIAATSNCKAAVT